MTKAYTITDTFELPSRGLVYDKKVEPFITVRSMTTQEEMLRLSPSDLQYKNLCLMIDSCIVDKIGISSYDMCMADYQYLLQKLRIVTYGPMYDVVTVCPSCGMHNKEQIDLSQIEVKKLSEDVNINDLQKIHLPVTDVDVEIKFQTPRMFDIATYNNKEYKQKASDSATDQTTVFLIQELIKTIDGKAPNKLKLTQWVRELPMKDTNILLASVEKLNKTFGIVNEIKCQCNLCLMPFYTAIRADREFFRPSVL